MAPRSTQRLGLLKVLLPRAHRFRSLRAVMALLSLALVAAVPLLELARVDLWRGGHLLLGRPASLGRALVGALLFGIACYLVTFLVNAVGGRLFCGFGCPVSQANRLHERAMALAGRPGAASARARSLAFSALCAGAVLHGWIDPALWREGSPRAVATAIGAWLALAAAVQLHARRWHWAFCRGWCPVGLYYSVVMPSRSFGIRFDRAAGTCVACNACDRICPVGLAPRDLLAEIERDEGLSIARATGVHHCLSCGDCIEACEHVLGRRGVAQAPLSFQGRKNAERASA
jgi:polyferredoxin